MNFLPPLEFAELSLGAILPSLVLIIGALILLLANVFVRVFDRAFRGVNVALCAVFLALSVLCSLQLDVGSSFFSLIHINGITILSQVTMEFAALVFIVLFFTKQEKADYATRVGEFYPLYLLMIAGFDIMVSSRHLLIILLGLEIGSLSLVALIALSGTSRAIEAGIKYFVFSVLASVFFIMGALCWYFASANFDLNALEFAILSGNYISASAILLGVVFMIGALGFKTSAVPFHSWMPDIYQGSNAIVAGVVSIIPKIAAFAVAINVFSMFIQSSALWVHNTLYVLVVLSITLPNIAALVQKDIKRMLAFSSIAHSGFVLACILINTQMSLSALYLYWFLFVFSNVGAFGLLWFVRNTSSDTYEYRHFSGLVRVLPSYAVLAGVFFISLAGIPPFGLFFGKVAVVMSAFSADYVYLGLIMMINSAIAVVYYLRPVIAMFLPATQAPNAADFFYNATSVSKLVVWLMAVVCCVSIFMVQFLLDFIGKYVIGAY